ncbi:MAG: Cna B-type domain-containing protein, partial [Lachnospiraceae bacterium]|nr:Cna B-type domain-containing protein [Lachnospiraceae bacterium]
MMKRQMERWKRMLAAVLAVLLLATNAFGGAGITAFADDTPEGAVSVTVPMSLALDAKAAAKTKTYTFVMAPEGTAPAVANGTVTLTAAGEGSFGPVVFTEPGDFTYKIRQTTTAEDGFILDSAVYDLRAYAYRNDAGDLLVSLTLIKEGEAEKKAAIAFSNSYADTSVSARKIWDDDNNRDGKRPDSLTFILKANGTEIDRKTAEEANDWTVSASGLPAVDAAGNTIAYTWDEADVANYDLTEKTADGTVTTFTNKHTPETVAISGSKVWNDAEYSGIEGYTRPTSIEIKLLADGEVVDRVEVEPDKDGNWSFSFTGLPKYKAGKVGQLIVYTVEETAVDGYTGTVSSYTVENTPVDKGEEVTPVSLKIMKTDGNTGHGLPGAVFTVKNSEGQTVGTYTTGSDGKTEIEFTSSGTYTMTETPPAGYTAETGRWTIVVSKSAVDRVQFDKDGGPNGIWKWFYHLLFGDGTTFDAAEGTLTVPNPPEETQITVTKAWDDTDDQDGIRPDSVTVKLLAGSEVIDTATLDEANEWTKTWTGLAKKKDGADIVYSVSEEQVPGYNVPVIAGDAENGYTITNTHAPEETQIKVTK